MTEITPELVEKAYVALVSLDREEAAKYWSEDVRFSVPGRHAQAGWHVGLDALLAFRRALTDAAGGKFEVELVTSMISGNECMDVVKVHAVRPGAPEGSTSPTTSSTPTGYRSSAGRTAASSRAGPASSATARPTTTSGGPRWTATASAGTSESRRRRPRGRRRHRRTSNGPAEAHGLNATASCSLRPSSSSRARTARGDRFVASAARRM